MITVIIALLMALGLLDSPAEYHTLTTQEQEVLMENIIVDDAIDM